MSCTITIVPAREFFRTKTNGEFDLDETRQALLAVFSKMKDANISEVLLDNREASTKMTASDILKLFGEFDHTGLLRARKIAILYLPKDTFDRSKFFEACAQARGYQIGAFQDFEEAVTWLYPPQEP
jgi:hypothetical protein